MRLKCYSATLTARQLLGGQVAKMRPQLYFLVHRPASPWQWIKGYLPINLHLFSKSCSNHSRVNLVDNTFSLCFVLLNMWERCSRKGWIGPIKDCGGRIGLLRTPRVRMPRVLGKATPRWSDCQFFQIIIIGYSSTSKTKTIWQRILNWYYIEIRDQNWTWRLLEKAREGGRGGGGHIVASAADSDLPLTANVTGRVLKLKPPKYCSALQLKVGGVCLDVGLNKGWGCWERLRWRIGWEGREWDQESLAWLDRASSWALLGL